MATAIVTRQISLKKLGSLTDEEIRKLLELTLMNLPNHFKEKLLQLDPQQVNDFMKKSMQEVEKKKIDKLVEKIKSRPRSSSSQARLTEKEIKDCFFTGIPSHDIPL